MITKPFDFVVVFTEKDKDGKDVRSELVCEGRVMAKNENAALIAAARKLPETYTDKLDEVEILVRPF